MVVLLQDALISERKAREMFEWIRKIVEFEEDMVRVRKEMQVDDMEEKKQEQDYFRNYDEIALEKMRVQDKDQMVKYFVQTKLIFSFVPFWYIPLNSESNPLSQTLRDILKLDIVQSKKLCDYLSCSSLDDIVTFQRHNKKVSEF